MESQIYYRPQDLATAEYLEHRLGRKSAYARSQTIREGIETTKGRSEQAIPLYTAQEIMQMKDHDVLAFHRRLPPLKVRRADFRNYPQLMKRREITPPKPPASPPVPELPIDEQAKLLTNDGYIDRDLLLNN